MDSASRNPQNRPAATPKSAAPKPVYFFDGGQIWSRLGELHAIGIGGAQGVLADLTRVADPTSRLFWPNRCAALRDQLQAAIDAYQTHWRAALHAEPTEDALYRAREMEAV